MFIQQTRLPMTFFTHGVLMYVYVMCRALVTTHPCLPWPTGSTNALRFNRRLKRITCFASQDCVKTI